jgi:hypothetical protein
MRAEPRALGPPQDELRLHAPPQATDVLTFRPGSAQRPLLYLCGRLREPLSIFQVGLGSRLVNWRHGR